MPELSGQPAELRFTLEIKRAATGETETFEMVGRLVPDEQTDLKEADDGCHPHDRSA